MNERQVFVEAIASLNDEGFNYIAWYVYQTSKTAGGFTDHDGWLRIRQAAEALPYIAEMQARFDAAEKALDDAPPTIAVPIAPKAEGPAHDPA